MKILELQWTESKAWSENFEQIAIKPQLVMFFTSLAKVHIEACCQELRKKFPESTLVGCTSSGEVFSDDVYEDTFSAVLLEFGSSRVELATVMMEDDVNSSFEAGKMLGTQLTKDGLRTVLVLSDGLKINGSELVGGIQRSIGKEIPISGGLAGDKDKFKQTYVCANSKLDSGRIALIGLYGDNLQVGHGSIGGWDEFGPVRKISKSSGNVLEQIDNENALDLYKKYLGEEYSKKLPGSALLFPMLVYPEGKKDEALVRTVLAVDEIAKTMTFAGDVPNGYSTQLMRANFDNIVQAAGEAASYAKIEESQNPSLALLISCVGRRMALGERTADEVENVQEILGENANLIGFYSYGEISPIVDVENSCALHNQTMTITVLTEKD